MVRKERIILIPPLDRRIFMTTTSVILTAILLVCFFALMIGVGAGFDFHAGTVKRAPKWMQRCCLEWLYRLFQDPKRLFKRYAVTNVKFLRYLKKHTIMQYK